MTEPSTSQQPAPPRRRTGLIVAIAAGAVALVVATVAVTAAVMSDQTPQREQAAVATAVATTPPAAAQTTTAAAPSTAAASPTPGSRKFGEKADGDRSTATAHGYKQPVAKTATPPDQAGFEWGAADVEVCVKVDGTLVNSSWLLIYADHTTIEPSSVGYQQFPLPAYPWGEKEVTAGQCVRGWITFPVPAGKRPATVQYNPQGFRADWAVT